MSNVTMADASIKVSPDEFLYAIFGPQWTDDAWVAAVADLTPSKTTNRAFYGRRAGYQNWNNAAKSNCYFAMGAIGHEPDASRKLKFWSYGPVVVLDDVGEKCDADTVRVAFGEPSFRVRTSAGSEQWGYILTEPVKDPLVMARIMRACTLAFYPSGKDPGHEPPVQYVRMPWGVNSKSKRVAENGGVAPEVMMMSWHPERHFDVLDLMIALGDAWDKAESDVGSSGSEFTGPRTAQEAREWTDSDEILQGLDKLGMVHWDHVQNGGYIEVDCPWKSEHAVSDDRTGYNPALAPTGHGFWCFHGSHGPKSDADVRDWLEGELGREEWKHISDEVYEKRCSETQFPVDDLVGVDWAEYASTKGVEVTIKQKKPVAPLTWQDFGAGVPVEMRPARRVISPSLIRGEVSAIAAQPGTGKSLYTLALSLALSAERSELVGEPDAFERTGAVYLISNEDAVDEVMRRRDAWLKLHDVDAHDLKHINRTNVGRGIKIITRSERNGPVSTTDQLAMIGADISLTRAGGRDVALVIFDTTASVLEGIEENDNTAMAQAIVLLASWAQKHDVAVMLVHHMPKAQGKAGGSGEATSLRGASALAAGVRCVLTLTGLTQEQEDELPLNERGAWVKLDVAKSSYGRPQGRRWFKKEGVTLMAADERVPGAWVNESEGVIVFQKKPPAIDFDPMDDDNVYVAVERVCAGWDSANEDARPLAVSGRSKEFPPGKVVIADALLCSEDDAKRLIQEAMTRQLIVVRERVNSNKNTLPVYAPTDKGARWVEERKADLPF